MVNIIVAVNNKGYIGKDNKLMWHNSEDLNLFKDMTKNHTIVMGRKTWESLPVKPLKGRHSIVISKSQKLLGNGFQSESEPNISLMAKSSTTYWVIGGEEIYKMFLPYANCVYVSKIDNDDIGDTRFPLEDVESNFICRFIRYAKTFKQYIFEKK